MDKKLFTEIPFALDFNEVKETLHIRDNKQMIQLTQEIIEKSVANAKPKGIYVCHSIEERGEDYIVVNGRKFISETLLNHTSTADKVFPYVITCGVELEKISQGTDDLLAQYIFDGVKSMILLCATDYISKHIIDTYGYKKLNYDIPGALNEWDMSEQAKLFDLIGNVSETIGVKLSDSNLMYPGKSVSGMYYPVSE